MRLCKRDPSSNKNALWTWIWISLQSHNPLSVQIADTFLQGNGNISRPLWPSRRALIKLSHRRSPRGKKTVLIHPQMWPHKERAASSCTAACLFNLFHNRANERDKTPPLIQERPDCWEQQKSAVHITLPKEEREHEGMFLGRFCAGSLCSGHRGHISVFVLLQNLLNEADWAPDVTAHQLTDQFMDRARGVSQ